jgi:hypothetical protein
LLASEENSLPPQLMETWPLLPLAWTMALAWSTAKSKSVKLFEAASTRTILAFGAMA